MEIKELQKSNKKKGSLVKIIIGIIAVVVVIVLIISSMSASSFKNAVMLAKSTSANFESNYNSGAIKDDDIYGISNKTGSSASDVIKSWGAVSKILPNVDEQKAVVNDSAMISVLMNEDLTNVATKNAYMLQAWGIYNSSEAEIAIGTDLYKTSKIGTFSLDELIENMTNLGPSLKGVASFTETIELFAGLTMPQTGFSKTVVINIFNSISKAVIDPSNLMNTMPGVGGSLKNYIHKNGMAAALDKLSAYIKDLSN